MRMRIAVVTGASSGLGREFVRQIAREGGIDEIWAVARRKERLLSLEKETGFRVRALPLDLTREDDRARYAALLSEEKPDVRVLVNASGYAKFGGWADISLADCTGMIDLNCTALAAMTQLTLPYLKKGSRVLEIASIAAFQPVPYLGVYAATKAFVLSYARSLGRELRPRGIAVTAVCPGWMKTEFFGRADPKDEWIRFYDCFHDPRAVAALALSDSRRGRDVSVHGTWTRCQRVLVKLLPHRLVMRAWEIEQHLPRK